jgi:PBP1b-binding outer membrane lipoprotein LpoB
MKILSLISIATLGLAGCATTPMGTVTPMKEGYTVEYSVNNGDVKTAKRVALNTAETECKKYNKGFYVISEKTDGENDYDIDDNTASIANTASTLLLGRSAVAQNRTVTLTFDCK